MAAATASRAENQQAPRAAQDEEVQSGATDLDVIAKHGITKTDINKFKVDPFCCQTPPHVPLALRTGARLSAVAPTAGLSVQEDRSLGFQKLDTLACHAWQACSHHLADTFELLQDAGFCTIDSVAMTNPKQLVQIKVFSQHPSCMRLLSARSKRECTASPVTAPDVGRRSGACFS